METGSDFGFFRTFDEGSLSEALNDRESPGKGDRRAGWWLWIIESAGEPDFAIGLISSPRWEQDTERKRRPSNDRVAGNKTEKKTVLSTPRGTRLRSAALQTIESTAKSEIGPSAHELD